MAADDPGFLLYVRRGLSRMKKFRAQILLGFQKLKSAVQFFLPEFQAT